MATYRSLLTKNEASRRNWSRPEGERFKVLRPVSVPEAPPGPTASCSAGLGRPAAGRPAAWRRRVPAPGVPLGRAPDADARAAGLRLDPRIDNDRIYEPPSGDVDPKLVVHGAESAPAEQYRGFLPTFLESAGLSCDPGDERRAETGSRPPA
jgi:hypothetical protein